MDYKAAYLHLMRSCEKARRQMEEAEKTIIAAQQWCENLIISENDSPSDLVRIK